MAGNNLFIHYPSRRGLRGIPALGLEENAFPDIVVGDFGASAMGHDAPDSVPNGIFDTDVVDPWEDIYLLGKMARSLLITHIPTKNQIDDWVERPERYPMAAVNASLPPGARPYSDDLVQLLRRFEWPDCANRTDPEGTQPDAGGNDVPNHSFQPDARWISDHMLPLARRKVRRYRNPPAGRPPGYFRRLDVSWTKPEKLMPFEYDWRYAPSEDVQDFGGGVNRGGPAGGGDDNDNGGGSGSGSGGERSAKRRRRNDGSNDDSDSNNDGDDDDGEDDSEECKNNNQPPPFILFFYLPPFPF